MTKTKVNIHCSAIFCKLCIAKIQFSHTMMTQFQSSPCKSFSYFKKYFMKCIYIYNDILLCYITLAVNCKTIYKTVISVPVSLDFSPILSWKLYHGLFLLLLEQMGIWNFICCLLCCHYYRSSSTMATCFSENPRNVKRVRCILNDKHTF